MGRIAFFLFSVMFFLTAVYFFWRDWGMIRSMF